MLLGYAQQQQGEWRGEQDSEYARQEHADQGNVERGGYAQQGGPVRQEYAQQDGYAHREERDGYAHQDDGYAQQDGYAHQDDGYAQQQQYDQYQQEEEGYAQHHRQEPRHPLNSAPQRSDHDEDKFTEQHDAGDIDVL